jgi:hypothetical protein
MCTPVPGKLAETVTSSASPPQSGIKQTVNGAVALDESVTPTYQSHRPNGPDCEPVCWTAGVALTLAAP